MIFILLVFSSNVLPLVVAVTVSTKYGNIEGFTQSYPQAPGPHKSIQRFLGIPFAAPLIGENRLKNPKPPKAWKPEVLQAKRHGHACMQGPEMEIVYGKYLTQPVTYNEDCLFLDVYTPSVNQTLPVMVYIHGGGYLTGSAMLYQGDMLATFGVVVVSIQYRLGAFGFVTTGDSKAPGNFGILDQVEALKWTHENIEHFGGDPTRVTIFGLSAGGSSVCLHLLSPLSSELFHYAIAESGVDLSVFAVQPLPDAIRHTKELAGKIDCDSGDNEDLVRCLRTKKAEDIQSAVQGMMASFVFSGNVLFSPVVDKHFLPDSPRNLRKGGKFSKVRLMVSFTSQEGGSFLLGFVPPGFFSNLTIGVSPESFNLFTAYLANAWNDREKNANLTADAMQFMYTPWPDNNDQKRLRQQLIDLVGDYIFVAPAHEVAAIHSQVAPVYMYEFAHRSRNGSFWPEWVGVAHGDNAFSVFGAPFMFNDTFDANDRNVSQFVMSAYTNFAKFDKSTLLVGGLEWDAFNSSHRAYLHITANPKMASNFGPRRMAFWNEYYPKLAKVNFEVTEKQHVNRGEGLAAAVGILPPVFLTTVALFLSVF